MLAWFSVKVTTCSFQHGLRTSHVFTAVYNVRSRHTPLRVNSSFLFRLYGPVKGWDIFPRWKNFLSVITSTSGRNHSRSGRNDVGETRYIRFWWFTGQTPCFKKTEQKLTIMIYILPPAFYLRVRIHPPRSDLKQIAAWGLMLTGLAVLIVCTYQSFANVVDPIPKVVRPHGVSNSTLHATASSLLWIIDFEEPPI